MLKYLLRKLGWAYAVLFGVSVIVFGLFHALPGDPADLLSGQHADAQAKERVRRDMGFDQPLMIQAAHYLNDLSFVSIHSLSAEELSAYGYWGKLELGGHQVLVKPPYLRKSFQTHAPVAAIIAEYLLGSLLLAVPALILAVSLGLLLGLVAATHAGRLIDRVILAFTVTGFSVPSFVIAIGMAIIFGYYLSEFTGLNLSGSLWETGADGQVSLKLSNMILPVLTLAIRPLSVMAQIMRNSLLEVLREDYILAASAKGLRMRTILLRHALPNALNPVLASASGWMISLLAGTFFVEYIFAWKGLGMRTLQAVEVLDLPVIMGAALAFAAVFVIVQVLTDMLIALIDPRVSLR